MRHLVLDSLLLPWLAKIMFAHCFLLPNSSFASRSSSPSPSSSSSTLSILASNPFSRQVLLWFYSIHQTPSRCSSRRPLENRRLSFRLRSSHCVQLYHENSPSPTHRNPLTRALVADVRFLLTKHDRASSVHERADGCQPSLDVCVQKLHAALLAFPHEFQLCVAFHPNDTSVCRCQRYLFLRFRPHDAVFLDL